MKKKKFIIKADGNQLLSEGVQQKFFELGYRWLAHGRRVSSFNVGQLQGNVNEKYAVPLKPPYGYNDNYEKIEIPEGWELVPYGGLLREGDKVWIGNVGFANIIPELGNTVGDGIRNSNCYIRRKEMVEIFGKKYDAAIIRDMLAAVNPLSS